MSVHTEHQHALVHAHDAGESVLAADGTGQRVWCDGCAAECLQCPMVRMLERLADIEATVDSRIHYLESALQGLI